MALTINTGAAAALDGSASSDPDGNPLTYKWTQTGGTAVVLSSTTVAKPTFTAPATAGALTFSLVVNDGTVNSAAATTTVTVVAAPTSGTNLALTSTVTASTQNTSTAQTAVKVIDNNTTGYPAADYSHEWATLGQGAGAWVKLTWTGAQTIGKIVLYDRPNTTDQITAGTLTFSNGTTVAVGPLNNDGTATTITFTPRSVTSVQLTVTAVKSGTANAGLAEFQAYAG